VLTQRLGHTPDDRELARHLAVTQDDVRQAHLAFTASSLDAPLSHSDDPGPLAGILGEDDPAVAHATDIEAVRVHLDELPERQQRILMLRSTATSPRARSATASASPRCTYPGRWTGHWPTSAHRSPSRHN
jgi:RNA polymerase sigma-B factor